MLRIILCIETFWCQNPVCIKHSSVTEVHSIFLLRFPCLNVTLYYVNFGSVHFKYMYFFLFPVSGNLIDSL